MTRCEHPDGVIHPHARTKPDAGDNTPAREIIRRLINAIGSKRYEMWFGRSTMHCENGTVEIDADSAFVAGWIRSHFAGELRNVCEQALGGPVTLNIRSEPARPAAQSTDPATNATSDQQSDACEQSDRHGRNAGPVNLPAAAPDQRRRHTGRERAGSRRKGSAPLRDLDDLVVGRSNDLAYAAACRMCDGSDSLGASPLLVHGSCGVGKTHLLQGVCHRFITLRGPGVRVRYVTAEQFTNEFILAVQQNTLTAFRRKVRNIDLLAIDDVHFLSNKSRTQSEFLHTLDSIDLNGSRVVLASDSHPRQMRQLSPPLISRLLSGMVVEIGMPDEPMRAELIRHLVAKRGIRITDSAVRSLAQQCSGSVRELQGAINQLSTLWMLQNHRNSIAPADTTNGTSPNGALHDGTNGQRTPDRAPVIGHVLVEQLFAGSGIVTGPIRIERIIEVVCKRLAVTVNDLHGTSRHQRVVLGRGLVASLAKRLTTLSFPEIARALGRRNHSTVHTAAKRIQSQIEQGITIQVPHSESPIALSEFVESVGREVRRSK